jgi:hypothetical protein
MPDCVCTNCKTYNYACTYAPKVRVSPISRSNSLRSPIQKRAVDPVCVYCFRYQIVGNTAAQLCVFRYIENLENQLAQAQEALRKGSSSHSSLHGS